VDLPSEILAGQTVAQLVDDDDRGTGQPQNGQRAQADVEGVEIGQPLRELSPFEAQHQQVCGEQRDRHHQEGAGEQESQSGQPAVEQLVRVSRRPAKPQQIALEHTPAEPPVTLGSEAFHLKHRALAQRALAESHSDQFDGEPLDPRG
jgi:hypothetical protein